MICDASKVYIEAHEILRRFGRLLEMKFEAYT